MPVTVGKRTLQVYYFGKGHTDGDAIVVIPDIKAAYTGDLFAEKALPVIDLASGGSALALPETLARAVREITDVARVITGHGRWPGSKPNTGGLQGWHTWNDFREYAEFTREFVDAVTAAWKKGRTAGQVAAELRMPVLVGNAYPLAVVALGPGHPAEQIADHPQRHEARYHAQRVAAELRMPEKYKDYRLDGAKAMIETIFNELKQSPAPKR